MTKTEQGREKRRKEAEQRSADRKSRLQEANRRQRNADISTYGEGSELLESRRGNIYDVETGAYDASFNKEGTDETIGNDGIDELDQATEGILNGYAEKNVILCEDGSPVNGTILFRPE